MPFEESIGMSLILYLAKVAEINYALFLNFGGDYGILGSVRVITSKKKGAL